MSGKPSAWHISLYFSILTRAEWVGLSPCASGGNAVMMLDLTEEKWIYNVMNWNTGYASHNC